MTRSTVRLCCLAVLVLMPVFGCAALGLSGTGSRILDVAKP